MRVGLLADVHLSDRPPSIRVEGYADQILAKLRWVVEHMNVWGVDVVVVAGDLFHRKTPSRTSHALVQRVVDALALSKSPVVVVPGNHDVVHDRLESLSRQPLGVLYRSGVAQVGIGDVEGIFCIPWLQDWDDLGRYMRRWRESDAQLLVTHAPIVPPGGHRPYFTIDANEWAGGMGRGGFVYYGHQHDPDGSYWFIQDDQTFTFCNEGAISRGSIHETSLARKPACVLWDSDEGSFLRVEVPHLVSEEVFMLASKADDDVRQERLDEFLTAIGQTMFDRVSVEKVLHDLQERQVRPEVLAEVAACFEEV